MAHSAELVQGDSLLVCRLSVRS